MSKYPPGAYTHGLTYVGTLAHVSLSFNLMSTVVVVVVVVGGSPLHFVLRTSLGLRNVNEVVEGVAYGRSLRVCNLEGSGGGC